jgi:multidrug resistance efflux pump
MLLACGLAHAADEVIVLSGSLSAAEAERFSVPVTSNWQATVKWLIPEGERVEVGDSIAVFDPGNAENSLQEAIDELFNKRHERGNEDAAARLARMNLELALKRAEVDYRKASIDAEVPQSVLKGADFRRRQLEMETKRRAFEDAQLSLLNHDATTRSKLAELEIEIAELERTQEDQRKELELLNLRATRAGIVIHEVHPWMGRKVVEGDRLQPTFPVAQIPDLATIEVEAWAGESEVARLEVGRPVSMTLDSHPEKPLFGKVTSVAAAGERRKSWGRASYFRVRISLDQPDESYMRPGMSVRCEIQASQESAP